MKLLLPKQHDPIEGTEEAHVENLEEDAIVVT